MMEFVVMVVVALILVFAIVKKSIEVDPKSDATMMKKDIVGFELPQLPKDGEAIVYVVRPSHIGTMVSFFVFLDEQNETSAMGYTRASEYIYFNVKPGDHKLLSKAENLAELNFTAKEGDIIFVQQNRSMGIMRAKNSLVRIQNYEGKYQVKHLYLGTIIKEDK